jgi:parallel beta-helix repeat protein
VQLALAERDRVGRIEGAPRGPLYCGFSVKQSITLTADIGPCEPPNTGLLVSKARNITIDLNGFTISDVPTDPQKYKTVGSYIDRSRNVTVEGGGTVEGFGDNIRAERPSGITIRGVTARDSTDDNTQLLNLKRSLIEQSTASGSAEAGLSIMGENKRKASSNTLRDNTISDAGSALIQVGIKFGRNRNNRVEGNQASGSADVGIQVWGSSDNEILDNEVSDVAGDGIQVRNGSFRNLIEANTVQGPAVGIHAHDDSKRNQIRGNTVSGSLQEDSPQCANTWRANTYGSKNRDCID